MLNNFKEQLKTAYQAEQVKQAGMSRQPASPARRNYFRKIGIFIFGLGWIVAIINVISFLVTGRTLIILLATMLAGWAIGAWMMITGKPLKK
jgi:hypothetical protein